MSDRWTYASVELQGVAEIGAEDIYIYLHIYIYGRYWPVDLFARLTTQPA